MDIIKRFKTLPNSSRKLLSAGIILALIVALPLFVWAIANLNFNPFKRASSGEPGSCIAINKVVSVTPISDTNGTCHDLQTAVDAVTGSGYTIQVNPGTYNVPSTVRVSNKVNLTITGNPQSGNSAAVLNFLPGNGWGFLFENSSGSIQWMTLQGGTSNGMLSIVNSNTFSVGYMNLNSQTSHTMDIQGSNNISVYNTDIQSSAGGLEIATSTNVNVSNNKLHNNANAISVQNSSLVQINSNLVYNNREYALRINNSNDLQISRNTFVNNESGVELAYTQSSNNEFSYNIVSDNTGPGIKGQNGLTFSTFTYNDVFGNGYNYYGYANQTGLNNNISANPQLNSANNLYCPSPNSPVVYGNAANFEYMGYIGPCGVVSSPSPSPSASPSPSPTANINPPLCSASSIAPATGVSPLTVTLHGGGNAGNGPGIDGYQWDFENNGSWDTGISLDPVTHTYNQPGTFYPKYRVHGTNNVWSTKCDYAFPVVVSSVPGASQSFTLRTKFAGVTGGEADGAKVTLRFQNQDSDFDFVTSPIEVNHIGNGVYQAVVVFNTEASLVPPGNRYYIYVKGEKHLAAKFCQQTGQTTRCTGNSNIAIPAATTNPASYVFEFTGLALEPGDLYEQDGRADLADFAKVVALMAKASSTLTAEDLLTADLNYDGYINIKDAFLMRKTLETKYDEN